MSTTRTGAGDPAKTLQLLWRGPDTAEGRRGPRSSLKITDIVAKAVAMADVGDLDTLTMRALAQEMGVSTMALYTYIPGKAELIDLMVDAAYLAMPLPSARGGWRKRLAAVADANRQLMLDHPWLASVATGRPALGPGAIAKFDRELAALDDVGLTDVEMDSALHFLLGFVAAGVRAENEAKATVASTGETDPEWWARNEKLLAKAFDAKKYPLAVRVGSSAGEVHQSAHNADASYRFGLACFLDGLEKRIDERAKRRRSR